MKSFWLKILLLIPIFVYYRFCWQVFLEAYFLTQVNYQYIKSDKDLLNRLKIIMDPKVPNSPDHAGLCCGWLKVLICILMVSLWRYHFVAPTDIKRNLITHNLQRKFLLIFWTNCIIGLIFKHFIGGSSNFTRWK